MILRCIPILFSLTLVSCAAPTEDRTAEDENAYQSSTGVEIRADDGTREVQVAPESFSLGSPLPEWVQRLPIPPTSRSDPVVGRLFDTQIRVDESQSQFNDEAIQVNDATALEVIGLIQLDYVPQYQQLHVHAVRILRGDTLLDRTESVGVRFLRRETSLESNVYDGSVTAALLVPDVRVGDTLSIAYRVDGSNPVFGKTYFSHHIWDSLFPTERRRVLLTYSEAREIHWRMLGDYRRRGIEPRISQGSGLRTLRFEEHAIAGIPPEPFVPDDYFAMRILQFSEFESWNAVGRWAEALFPPAATLPGELRSLLRQFDDLPDKAARVAAALRWVQGEVRYFSVSIGESSHRPHTPELILERRYGDCKDKTYLLLTMLRRMGVDATPVLVSDELPRAPGKVLPSPFLFDHALVRVRLDGRELYLDPTRRPQPVPLARLAPPAPGTFGLIASSETTDLEVISTPDAHPKTVEVQQHMRIPTLAPGGTLDVKTTWSNALAEKIRMTWGALMPENRRKLALQPYERLYPGIELTAEPEVVDDLERNRFTLVYRFRAPKLARSDNGDWVVRFVPDGFVPLKIPPSLQRTHPLVVATHPIETRYALLVEWPPQVSGWDDPETRTLDGEVFRAEATTSFRGSRAEVNLRLKTKVSAIAANGLPNLMEDLRQLRKLIGGVVVADQDMINLDAKPGVATVQEKLRLDLEETIDLATQSIRKGELMGGDLAEAYCLRATALSYRERHAEALQDSAEAVRIAPALARAWSCRGTVLYNNGEFDAADAAFTRAMVLGGARGAVLKQRAMARFFLDRLPEAAADFEQAAASDDSGGNDLFALLWQISTLQRAGAPLPDDVIAIGRRDPRGPWPRPALAMLVGDTTPAALLAQVEELPGDERVLTLAEAWFYVGQRYLVEGRVAEARAAFEKCRDQGITGYYEHVAAGFELARLGMR